MKKGEAFTCELEVEKGRFNRESLCNQVRSQLWLAGERITTGFYEVTIKKIDPLTLHDDEEVHE